MACHTIWSYLWDLVDDGLEDSVRYLGQELGLDAVSVATAYHTFQQLRPRRPGAKLLTGQHRGRVLPARSRPSTRRRCCAPTWRPWPAAPIPWPAWPRPASARGST